MNALEQLADLEAADSFVARHVAPSEAEIAAMLKAVGAVTLDDLASKTVPGSIRSQHAMDLHRRSTRRPPLPSFARCRRITI